MTDRLYLDTNVFAALPLAPGFDALFDRFAESPTSTGVVRWEAHQAYQVGGEERSLSAWRARTERPERSLRTNSYLREVATAVLAGKEWVRLRKIAEPASEYVRWELESFRESQAVGEQVRIAVNDPCELPDVWLFDGSEERDRIAALLDYDSEGAPVSFRRVDDPEAWRRLREALDAVRARTVTLNAYLAGERCGAV